MAARPWYRRGFRNLRNRWVQVGITLFATGLVIGMTAALLRPKPLKPGAAVDPNVYKFIHCDNCLMELPYNKDLDGHRCPKCLPPKVGFFVATKRSVKDGAELSKWRWFNLAAAFEGVAALGVIVFLAYLPTPDPTSIFYLCNCPHCGQRMRFRQVSLGGAGMCPRCRRVVKFPEEDEAVTELEVMEAERLQALAEQEARLAEAGE
jgi:hypothetical protein